MPSPTDSTCPTSETSASWPKFLICSFRMAEISAARISISGLFHRDFDRIELGAERAIDHAAADLDDEPADNGGLDLDVEVDVLAAGRRFERALERVEILIAELFGDGNFRDHLALVTGGERAKGADHVAHREQPAVGSNDA